MQCYKPILLAVAFAALSSCSLFDNSQQFGCPVVGVPRETSTLTRFRAGPGRDLTDVVFDVGIQNAQVDCKYSSSGVSMQLGVLFGAERGPAATARTATVPYFIAIVDPDRNILAKEVFTTTLSFPPNVSQTGVVDQTEETIPLPKNKSAEAYGIVVGMQLTPEEIEYNRNKILR